MPSDPLKLLGKYQLTDVLGEGAMGVVYRAFDPVLNRYLAVKVMSSMIACDAELRDRFLREARAAGSLQHPNVITIYDFGEVGDHLFIAMEYVEGVDLSEIIERRDNISLATKLDIIIDVLNGLAYAHSRGVVHRDIKPANIRVAVDAHAKLMDFGIARLQSSEMTRVGELLGTPQYMAPEQVTGGAVTPATDIFALGAVLYELLTYTKAFAGDTLHIILFNIVSAEPRPLRQAAAGLPSSLEPIIAKALAKDPDHRYQTSLAMAKDLAAARAALSISGHTGEMTVRASQIRTLGPPGGRRTRWWPIPAAAALVLVAAVAFRWFGVRPVDGQPADPNAVVATQEPMAPPATAKIDSSALPSSSPGAVETPRLSAPDTRVPPRAGTLSSRAPIPSPVQRQPLRADAGSEQKRATNVPPRDTPPSVAPQQPQTMPAPPPVVSAPAPAAVVNSLAVSPKVVPPAAASQAEPVSPPVDPRPEIERVIAAYGRAIESGSVSEIRRVFPGLSAQQQRSWDEFFRSVRNLKAQIAIEQLTVRATTAEAVLSAVYEFENKTNGQIARQPLRLQATLSRDPSGWRIASIR